MKSFLSVVKAGALLLGIMLTAFISDAQTFTAKPNTSMTSMSKGFYEYLPEGYSSGTEKYPLLIFFHGMGEMGNGNSNLSRVLNNGTPRQINNGTFPKSFTVRGETFRFIVLVPQFTDWPQPEHVDELLDYASSHYRVDTDRIYLTGLSMGGGVIWYFAGKSTGNSERLAAIVPICGAGWPERSRYENMARANLPVWATHNSGDGDVPVFYTDEFVDGMNNYPKPPNPRAKKTIFQANGHDAWSRTYDLNFKENGLNVYEWMLTHSRQKSILAVTDLKFAARESNGTAVLNWTTADEKNNTGFLVERSSDGLRFDSLAFVGSAGSGGSYGYTDLAPVNGQNMYRVKAVSTTGEITYSNVVSLAIRGENQARIFPNPVHDVVQLQVNYQPKEALIRIFDMSGKAVTEKKISGSGTHQLNLTIPAGAYSLVLIENGQTTFKQTFIKR